MGLSMTETRRLWPLLQNSFLSQVTTGCDPVLIPKALSAFVNEKELILVS
jgi:hypothetical protein